MGETPPSYQINFSSLCAHLYFVLLTIQYIPHKETEVSGNMHTSWTLCVLNTYKNYVKWLMKSCVKKTVYHYIQYSLFKGAGIPKIFLKICTMVFETFSPNYQQCCRKFSGAVQEKLLRNSSFVFYSTYGKTFHFKRAQISKIIMDS